MATKEVLQEGTVAKPEAKTNSGLRAWLLGSGGAKKAADAVAPATRRSRLDEEEKKAVGYAGGGAVSDRDGKRYTGTVSDKSGDYESYRDAKDKEHLIAPATGKAKGSAGAGRGHAYAAGGTVSVRRGFGKARGA